MQSKRKWKQEQLIKQREMGFGAVEKREVFAGKERGKKRTWFRQERLGGGQGLVILSIPE